MFCSALSSMYWCPDMSELYSGFGKTVHPKSAMASVNRIFVCDLVLSWKISNSDITVMRKTQLR